MESTKPDFTSAMVFTGGGTGGHYFPAVALAEGARKRWPGRPIAFVGARRGIEAKLLPGTAWPHILLDVEGFVGRSPFAVLRSIFKLFLAWSELKRLWKAQRPDAVIATGGYGSAPALLAAKSLGIPYFLHESNAEPGRLVQMLAKGARRVWCGMKAVEDRLPGAKCLLVGTPVRDCFLRSFQDIEDLQPPYRLLALGGSGGARVLNDALFSVMPALLDQFPEWEMLHQTGARDLEALLGRPRHERHKLEAFLEHMDQEIEAASLVVSRSGASSCAELKCCGRPALMVPMPNSAGDHQKMNALAMVEEGRAVMVEQDRAFEMGLESEITRLMSDMRARRSMSKPEPNRAVDACLDDLM